MKPTFKIWLDNKGKAFGRGPCELLKRVEESGSLNRAASQMGMSYSKAWRLIGTMEKKLGFTLLDKTVGGPTGGGSKVTPQATELMKRYDRFEKDVKESIEQIYENHFGNFTPKIPPAPLCKGGMKG
jgi:molybdate transport system regulatory protein